jgi:hypothetical protein
MGKKSGSGIRIRDKNPDYISESLETIFWVKIFKFFDADPGWKKFGSGINIPDSQHWLRIRWLQYAPRSCFIPQC